MGLGRIMLHKLADAALKNGIPGIVAYTAASNRRMIRLFQGLPYKTRTVAEDGALTLTCKFEALHQQEPPDEPDQTTQN